MSDIAIQNLGKVFDGAANTGRVVALESITCDIPQGEFLCIIGPSGCGKSTLLNILAGFAQPTTGTATNGGKPIPGPGPDRTVMFQEYGLFPWMTVRQNIEFGLKAKGLGAKERAEIVRHYIDLVSLAGFEDRYPHQISGGMKQRVSIARALAPDPDIVLMDEPFAALDSLTRDVMQEEILRIWGGAKKTFVLITHNIDEAIFLGDRVLVMTHRPGRVKQILSIDIPRPRDPSIRSTDPRFLGHREHLANSLRREVQDFVADETRGRPE